MFLLFGRGGGRKLLIARLVLLAVFLIVVFAFHPHGTTLDIVQAARIVVLVALVGTAWLARRRRRDAPAPESD